MGLIKKLKKLTRASVGAKTHGYPAGGLASTSSIPPGHAHAGSKHRNCHTHSLAQPPRYQNFGDGSAVVEPQHSHDTYEDWFYHVFCPCGRESIDWTEIERSEHYEYPDGQRKHIIDKLAVCDNCHKLSIISNGKIIKQVEVGIDPTDAIQFLKEVMKLKNEFKENDRLYTTSHTFATYSTTTTTSTTPPPRHWR